MRRVTRVSGQAGPDLVWRRYTDFDRWPRWSPQIRHVDAPAPRVMAGLFGTVHGPCGVRVPFRILQVDDAARRWTWRVQVPGMTLDMEHAVDAAPGGGTITTFRLDGPAPVAVLYSLAARPALHRLVDAGPY